MILLTAQCSPSAWETVLFSVLIISISIMCLSFAYYIFRNAEAENTMKKTLRDQEYLIELDKRVKDKLTQFVAVKDDVLKMYERIKDDD